MGANSFAQHRSGLGKSVFQVAAIVGTMGDAGASCPLERIPNTPADNPTQVSR
jgi:hypothetical protein